MDGFTDHAKRVAFGKGIGAMRDRIFDLGPRQVRIQKSGTAHNAVRWQLAIVDSAKVH